MNHGFLGLSVFLASSVEMIEALTIVLAIGVSREWRSALYGVAAAVVSLGLVIIIFGSVLLRLSDDSSASLQRIWLVLGGLLLIYGLQWLRKAILRYAGVLPVHDEDETFLRTVANAGTAPSAAGRTIDWFAFVVVFKSVWLEGLEVVFIVLAFGASQSFEAIGYAAWVALAAAVVVALVGVAVHRPLSRVPANHIKYVVGLLLTTFGTYFAAKGAGVTWPYGDADLARIVAVYLLASQALIQFLMRSKVAPVAVARKS